MKKKIIGVIVSFLMIGLYSTGSFAFEKGLGDLGKPPDYDQTIKRFRRAMPDFETFVDQQPSAFDWRDYGVVTPAGDQGSCGSCWAFTSVGALESKILILGGPEYNFSEQQQVSCNTSMAACCGGSSTALRFWYTQEPMEETCTGYGDYSTSCICNPPFHCSQVPCSDLNSCSKLRFHTTGYYTVDTSDPDEVKASLYEDGPAYFRFDVYSDFGTFWSTGSPGDVYVNTGGTEEGGHAILLVGWDDNKNAWLCKNSWGATSGPNGDGTFWIARSGHANNLNFGMGNVEIEPRVWYVDGAVASSGDGSSWTAAFKTIQEAIAVSINGDEIWVKEGTYEISDYIEVDKVVGIYGGFEGDEKEDERDQRDWRKYETTVDGQKGLAFDVVANATIDGFTITNCSGDYGGAMMIVPLNPAPATISPTIRNCKFTQNKADSAGGAIYTERAFTTFTNCVFSGNTAGAYGGAIHNFESSPGPTFTNCIFFGNTSDGYGGAVSNYMSNATYFLNCTFYGNKAKYYGGAISNLWNGYYITNSILWGDSAGEQGQEIYNWAASTTVCYSDIQGGHYGTGNIDEDPKFADAARGDFHLKIDSPCVDHGIDTPPDLPPLEPKPTPRLPDTDFEGDPRIIDGNNDGTATVDMGADEYVGLRPPAVCDFDGDGKTDNAIYRRATGVWWINPSGAGTPYAVGFGGHSSDIAVAEDYEGDGQTDIAIYRAATGVWWILPSSTGTPYAVGFGGHSSDIPVPGDYDGDGEADIAIYRAATGVWWIRPSSTGTPYPVGFGGHSSDIPTPGDYDGDGEADIAIYRAATGVWWVRPSSTGTPYAVGWGGHSSDIPTPGDYDGDGEADIVIYRSGTGVWWIRPSSTGTPYPVGFGGHPSDMPVPGDYDGYGEGDIAVYRSATGVWWIRPSSTGTPYPIGFGGHPSDMPVNPAVIHLY